jgi:LEA14-like dessication related protein
MTWSRSRIRFSPLFILLFLAACQKPLAPDYLGFSNAQFRSDNLKNTQVQANLKFYNPNNFGVKLKKADMDIFLNDKLANHYILDSTILINKLDTFYIPVNLQLDLKSLMGNAMQLLVSRKVKIGLDGKIRFKRGILPFKKHFHYEVNQSLDSLQIPGF